MAAYLLASVHFFIVAPIVLGACLTMLFSVFFPQDGMPDSVSMQANNLEQNRHAKLPACKELFAFKISIEMYCAGSNCFQ